MRGRDHTRPGRLAALAAVLAVAAAIAAGPGCVSNTDPRRRSVTQAITDGKGGWIVLTTRTGEVLAGELISVEPIAVRVLVPPGHLRTVVRDDVVRAELFGYRSDSGNVGAWGALGTLSALSHGFFFFLSGPIWLTSAAIAGRVESTASRVTQGDGWAAFTKWARFPQGLPAGAATKLERGDRRRPLPAPTAPLPAGPPGGGAPTPAPVPAPVEPPTPPTPGPDDADVPDYPPLTPR